MARTVKPLTETQIKNSKPKDKNYTLSDGRGMYLEVTTNGGKWWRFRYNFNDKVKKVSLGVYPDVTLANARTKRDSARNILANENKDPFAKEVVQKIVVQKTFKTWAEWYINEISSELSDSHITRTVKGFKKDVYPAIGSKFINDIRTKDIIQIMHTMKDRDATESARKTFSSIKRVFEKAISNFPDEIERNPTSDIKISDILGAKKTTNYPIITDAKELGILLINIQNYTGHITTKLALLMIAHTFVRPSIIRYAKWNEIDFTNKQWIIPASKMKTKKELIVPLSSQVIQILNDSKNESPYLFPSIRSNTTPMSDNTLVGALRRLGYTRDEIVAHSFRGIFSTIAHEQALFSHDAIETQLAHTIGSNVSQAYNRAKYLDERTKMMQWWSDYLTTTMK